MVLLSDGLNVGVVQAAHHAHPDHKLIVAYLVIVTRVDLFQNLFTNLPIASLVGEWALVIHGGLFREEDVTLDDIRAIDACRQPPSVLQARTRTPAQ